MKMETKTIEGAHGPCEYTCTPHAAEDGVDLLPVLMTIGAPILGGLFGAGEAPSEGAAMEALSMLGGEGGGEGLDAELDGAKIEAALRGFAIEFAKAGGSKLCRRVLMHTVRTPEEGERAFNLGKPADFNESFQANYLELGQALVFAIRVNYLPSSRASSGGGLIARLTQSLSTLRD